MFMTLKAARGSKELSRKAAAELIGVSYSTLYNWENGRSTPRADLACKVAEIYGVKVDDIIFSPRKNAKSNA